MHPGNIQTWLACGNVLSNIPQTVNKPVRNEFVNSTWVCGTAIPKSRFPSVLQTCILYDCMVWSYQSLTQASNFQQLVKCKQRFQSIFQYTYSNVFLVHPLMMSLILFSLLFFQVRVGALRASVNFFLILQACNSVDERFTLMTLEVHIFKLLKQTCFCTMRRQTVTLIKVKDVDEIAREKIVYICPLFCTLSPVFFSGWKCQLRSYAPVKNPFNLPLVKCKRHENIKLECSRTNLIKVELLQHYRG